MARRVGRAARVGSRWSMGCLLIGLTRLGPVGRGGSRSACRNFNICRPPIQRDDGFRPGNASPLIREAWRVASTGRSGLTWGPATFLKGATPHPADSIAPPYGTGLQVV